MYNYRETVDRLMEGEVAGGQAAGASYLCIRGGEELYFHACGCRDLERKLPMTRDTIIRLFSMSKPITAAAVMVLAERGQVDLWDPVSRYLPCFEGQKVWNPQGDPVPVRRESTLWDMLNMTSGIPYPENWEGCSQSGRQMDALFRELIGRRLAGNAPDTQEYMRQIARVPLVFQPGERWMYGLSADVLGAVIEKVSGKRFGQFLKDELFDPLEMPDTGFFVPEGKRERFAQNYKWSQDEKKLVPFTESHLGEYYGEDVAFESGGAGMVSTIQDYSHFALMMVQKGVYRGRRILGEKTVEFMAKDRLSESQKRDFCWDSNLGYGYGCLMRVLTDQGSAGTLASLGEYGWDGWTGNYVTIDPADDMVMLYFIQRCGAGTTPLVRKLRNVTYGALKE